MPPHTPPNVICAGLACLDLSLHNTRPPETLEQITPFTHTTHSAGGSAPQTALALAALNVPTAVVTLLGDDAHGRTLAEILSNNGVDTAAVLHDPAVPTSLSVLPVFTDGRRGCFVTLGANTSATPDILLSALERVDTTALRAFHFGYPHLMPRIQGEALANLLISVKARLPDVQISLDLNGADVAESSETIVTQSLPLVDFLHANLEEACIVTGLQSAANAVSLTAAEVKHVVEWFTKRGVRLVAITAGKDGVFFGNSDGAFLYKRAYCVGDGVIVNASGAGDAFVAGILSMLVSGEKHEMSRLADAGMASSLRRIEPSFGEGHDIESLLQLAELRSRIAPSTTASYDGGSKG